jgi:hypothetical protein
MDRLVEILADMLRSALAWEEERGVSELKNSQTLPKNGLTNAHQVSKVKRNATAGKLEKCEYEHDKLE